MKLSAIRADLDKELQGAWVPYAGDIVLKIARWNNERCQEAYRKLLERRKVLLDAKELTDEQRIDVQKEAASQTILLDWKGVEDDDGQPIPYSSDTALEWFRDKELWRLWNFVFMQSFEEENFRKEQIQDAEKNSATS